MSKKHGNFKKLVSVIVLTVFFCNVIQYTAGAVVAGPQVLPGAGTGDEEKAAVLDIATFNLSPELGTVRYSYKGSSGRVLVHIQDAHCNYDAQKKVAAIIEYLNAEYGIAEVNLEGGAGEYDLSVFTDIYDKDVRRRTADYFMRWGRVNGAEFFALTNPDKITLWGVEDAGLYIKNLDVYRDSLGYKDKVEGYLKELKYFINNLKGRIFSKELLDISIKYAQYKTGNLDFKDYLAYLLEKAKQMGIDIKSYFNIYLLSEAIAQEDNIDFKRANTERDMLIDELQKVLSKKELSELVANTVRFKSNRLSRGDFYEYLLKKAKQAGQKLEDYPELREYIVYMSLYEAVDKSDVMAEMEKLETRIKEMIYRPGAERELDTLAKNLVLMENMFNIELTKEDYGYYLENSAGFDTHNYVSFIEREAPKYGMAAALGGALAQGRAVDSALGGIARNPAASGKILVPMILGLALIESLVIYALIIAFSTFGTLAIS